MDLNLLRRNCFNLAINFIFVKYFQILALIPVILSLGIIPIIPFSEAIENNQICIDKIWIENSKGKIACVTSTTAEKLVERGWGTLLDDDTSEMSSSETNENIDALKS